MRVLRLSVQMDWRTVDPPPGPVGRATVGGQAAQVARLTAALDALGVRQELLVAPLADTPRTGRLGGAVVRAVGPARDGVHQRAATWAGAVVRHLGSGVARDVDLVHVHGSGLAEPVAVAALVPRLTGRPVVVTLHCSAQVTYRTVSRKDAAVQIVTRAAERRAIAAAARTFVLTERTRAALARQGRVEAIGDAVEADRIAAGAGDAGKAAALRAELGIAPGVPLVAYIGRLSSEKGVRDLPGLARALGDRGAHVVAFGDGPLAAELRAAAGERLQVVGSRPASDVHRLLGAADVVVLPSRFEELGSVLLEAQAAGVVCVAAAVGGTAEAIEDGVTGLLVPAADAEALHAAVARALDDDRLRASAAEQGPRRIAARFDIGTVARRTLEVYEEISGALR